MSGIRGRWGGRKIRLGGINSKCGIKSECWGNWGWFFLRRLDLYNRSGNIELDRGGLYLPAALWEDFWGSLKRRCCIILVRSGLLGEIIFLCPGWYNGRNWLATGWMGRMDQMGWGWGWGTDVIRHRIGSATIVSWVTGEGRRWEAAAGTNCVDAARARSICVGAAK